MNIILGKDWHRQQPRARCVFVWCVFMLKCEVVASGKLACVNEPWVMLVCVCSRKWRACDQWLCARLCLCVFLLFCACMSSHVLTPLHKCGRFGILYVCPVGMAAAWWQPLSTLHCLLRRPLKCPLTLVHTHMNVHNHSKHTFSSLLFSLSWGMSPTLPAQSQLPCSEIRTGRTAQ